MLLGHRPKGIQGLALERLDPRRVGDFEEMGHAENRLGVAVGVGRMDVGFDDIVVHEAIDDVGTFTFCGAEDRGTPKKTAAIDKGVG
jgi:hypothetical protein